MLYCILRPMKTSAFNHKRLRETREDLGWSQEQMISELYAQGLQITRATLLSYETGKTEPDVSDACKIAAVLKKPLEFFLTT